MGISISSWTVETANQLKEWDIRTVNYAVKILGYKGMKRILSTSELKDKFRTDSELAGFNFEKFRKQSQFCGVVLKVIGG